MFSAIAEMFSAAVAGHLRHLGHDARHVRDLRVAGRTDDEVLAVATVQDRVGVTENAVDFILLLEAAASAGVLTPPVVLARRTLPPDAGAMANELANRLARWAPQPPRPLPPRALAELTRRPHELRRGHGCERSLKDSHRGDHSPTK